MWASYLRAEPNTVAGSGLSCLGQDEFAAKMGGAGHRARPSVVWINAVARPACLCHPREGDAITGGRGSARMSAFNFLARPSRRQCCRRDNLVVGIVTSNSVKSESAIKFRAKH
jgi:hypothetical protein